MKMSLSVSRRAFRSLSNALTSSLIFSREVIPHRIVEHGLLSVESFTLPKVNEEDSEKVPEVEQKFNEVRRPVYEKRNEIIRTIPDFWLNAFLSHPALGELLNHEDQQNFKPNPYFEDTKLVKTFTFLDEGTTKIVGTPIMWKEGMICFGSGRDLPECSTWCWNL